MKGTITFATQQGQRRYQEDRIVAQEISSGYLLGIMDGHGGAEVSEFCSQNLVSIADPLLQKEQPRIALRKTIRRLHEETKYIWAGSTISIVYIPFSENRMYAAVLGDSPIIVWTKRGKLKVSPEHNARTNLKDRAYAIERGATYEMGYVCHNGRGLQPTKALGDARMDSVLRRTPQVASMELGDKSYILLASDGLLDPGHDNTAESIRKIHTFIQGDVPVEHLVDYAVKLPTRDNVSAILFKPEGWSPENFWVGPLK